MKILNILENGLDLSVERKKTHGDKTAIDSASGCLIERSGRYEVAP